MILLLFIIFMLGDHSQRIFFIVESNSLEMLDTPGVMPPVIKNHEQTLWLSALHAIPEKILDSEDTACYIIEHILKYNPSALHEHYEIEKLELGLVLLE